jgi:hypothetical protein
MVDAVIEQWSIGGDGGTINIHCPQSKWAGVSNRGICHGV